MHSILRTPSVPFIRLFASSFTGAIPSDPAPSLTEPTGDGTFGLTRLDSSVPNNGSLVFFGSGTAGQTAEARVFLWHRVALNGGNTPLYVPSQILDLTLTLGAAVGVVGTAVLNTDKFVNTIVISANSTTSAKDVSSPATTNGIAKVDFDLLGASHIQILLGVTNLTNINVLFRNY